MDLLIKAFEYFFENVDKGNWLNLFLILFFVVVGVIMWKFIPISEFFDRRSKEAQIYLQESLAINTFSKPTEIFFTDLLHEIIFKRVTGITADKIFREKIILIIEKSNGKIQRTQIAKAWKYLFLNEENGILSVKLEKSDKYEDIFSRLIVGIMVVLTMLCILTAMFSKVGTVFESIGLIFIGIIFFGYAMYVASTTIPYSVAKKIEPIISEIETPKKPV